MTTGTKIGLIGLSAVAIGATVVLVMRARHEKKNTFDFRQYNDVVKSVLAKDPMVTLASGQRVPMSQIPWYQLSKS